MKRVLISGAGIAGSALAFWLNHYGFATFVVEQSPTLRRGGQAVDIRGVALTVVANMGLRRQIMRQRTRMRGMTVLDRDGDEIGRTTEATFSSGRLDSGDVELLREDLVQLLYERTCGGTRYMFDDSITGIDDRAGGIHVSFEHAPPSTFDLVIGADGLHSRVRALIFGNEEEFSVPLGMQTAIFSSPNFLAIDDWQIWLRGGDAGYGIYPVRDNRELRITLGYPANGGGFDCHDVIRQKHRAAAQLAHLRWKTPEVIEAMWAAADFYTDAMAQIHMPYWSRGRVALLGDAAHCASPLSGQGTSLALVGAYVMAGELAKSRDDHRVAFDRYEERMRPFVLRNQALAIERPLQPALTEAIDVAKNTISLGDLDSLSSSYRHF
jgi:2-polyprenyl-6-methoxyphenol hydroxylase-like FAD-dependent oxidoreductase